MEATVSRVKVKFVIEGLGEAEGELVRHLAPITVNMVVRKLPFEGRAAFWKEEVYFEIPVRVGEEKAMRAQALFAEKLRSRNPTLDFSGPDRRILQIACQDLKNYLKACWGLVGKEGSGQELLETFERFYCARWAFV